MKACTEIQILESRSAYVLQKKKKKTNFRTFDSQKAISFIIYHAKQVLKNGVDSFYNNHMISQQTKVRFFFLNLYGFAICFLKIVCYVFRYVEVLRSEDFFFCHIKLYEVIWSLCKLSYKSSKHFCDFDRNACSSSGIPIHSNNYGTMTEESCELFIRRPETFLIRGYSRAVSQQYTGTAVSQYTNKKIMVDRYI